ncbi:MAG: hypothetical protein GXY85_12685 [Candidatus Brocadiaceae bacterium]|nr:hypothetical protein [Candidatus Brocadiaceae bacterium]
MCALRISEQYVSDADFVLYPGDCRDLLADLPDRTVRLVVTSPPCNLGKSYEDRTTLDDYIAQQTPIIEQCVRVVADDGSICWQVGNDVDNGEIVPLDIVLFPVFASLGLHLRYPDHERDVYEGVTAARLPVIRG